MSIHWKYEESVQTAVRRAIGISPAGVLFPVLDVAGISGIWVAMVSDIAQKSGHQMTSAFAAKFVASLVSGISAYWTGSKIFSWAFNLVPGIGTLASMGINALLNAWFTYRLGKSVSSRFEKAHFDKDDAGDMALDVLKMMIKIPYPSELQELVGLAFS